MLRLFFFISLNDTITHFISSFYCFVASFVSLFDGMIFSCIALSFVHASIKRQTKTFNSFSVKLYLPSDVSFSDHFRIYLLCCCFFCVNLKERTLAQGKCRFCITSTAFALCQIVTVLKYKKKTKISFPFRIYLFVVIFFAIWWDRLYKLGSFFLLVRIVFRKEYYFLFVWCVARDIMSVDLLWSRKLNRN